MLLDAAKLILTQNNFQVGIWNIYTIKMLNIHAAEAQDAIEKEVFTRRYGEELL